MGTTVRQWLRANDYDDVADLIDDVLAEFKAKESKERRNWADVLCGKKGKPVTIAGRAFPILASAQASRGLPVSSNAIRRNEKEEFPLPRRTERWPKSKRLETVTTTRLVGKPNRRRHARAS